MYDKSQLLRGTLEGCILQILSLDTTYGYEIVSKLQSYGFEDVREGTIYPLLLRLENKGIISSEFRPSPLGPHRKYYSITKDGRLYLDEFKHCWHQVVSSINQIFEMEE